MDIKQRFQEIRDHSDTIKVKAHGKDASVNPLFSSGYLDCNAVVLLHPEIVGLSHYHLDLANPYSYIKDLIKEVTESVDINDITAVSMGGEIRHFNINKKVLGKYGIPSIAEYSEGLGVTDRFPQKDLIVIPKTLEVLMYTKPDNYIRITPTAKGL